MNINLTLVVQMVVFATLVWGTMKWIWPVILAAMDERQRKIAQGLAAAEEGEQELSQARDKADAIVLRSIRFAEADRVLHLYTLERGRVNAIAKGVRKTGSRFGAPSHRLPAS